MNNLNKKTIKYFWKHIRNYKASYVIMLVSLTFWVVLDSVLAPLYFKDFFEILNNFDGGDVDGTFKELVWVLGKVALAYLVGNQIFHTIADYHLIKSEAQIMRDIENDSFKKLQNHSYGFFANQFVGGLVAKVGRLVRAFENINDVFTFHFYTAFIRFAFILVVLFVVFPGVAIILSIWTVIYIIYSYLFSRWKYKYDRLKAESDSEVTANFADSATNAVNIKMFTSLEHEKKRFGEVTQKNYEIKRKAWNLDAVNRFIQAFLMTVLELGLIYFMLLGWRDGDVAIPLIILVQSYMITFFMNLWDLGRMISNLYSSFGDSAEMIEIIYDVPEIVDSKKPRKSKIKKGEIEFVDVRFAYSDNSPVFDDFDLKIEAGEKVGLVGESGAGKSTIAKLLLRFADIESGDILIDGQSIYSITQENLRSNISFVPQEPILFHRTLMENIRYGDLDATRKQVFEAARKANAHDFIEKMSQKYNTFVGERGVKLSGGERQRVAIARAILKNTPILILDEATSALDSQSEVLIQEALANLMKDKTAIVIAHRLSTLSQMDRIIVLGEDGIAETGTHEELIEKKNGVYAKLWKHQAGGFLSGG